MTTKHTLKDVKLTTRQEAHYIFPNKDGSQAGRFMLIINQTNTEEPVLTVSNLNARFSEVDRLLAFIVDARDDFAKRQGDKA